MEGEHYRAWINKGRESRLKHVLIKQEAACHGGRTSARSDEAVESRGRIPKDATSPYTIVVDAPRKKNWMRFDEDTIVKCGEQNEKGFGIDKIAHYLPWYREWGSSLRKLKK